MDQNRSHLYVTKPALPDLSEFVPYLERIWASHQLTNDGPYHQEFEQALAKHLAVDHVSLFANGTLALLTALQALRVVGEVITTPFSFVATTHVLAWNRLRPVFVDIDPDTFNLDPERIEEAITHDTTAILPVHLFGTPCDVDRLAGIAAQHNLRIIYDAAHAFNVEYRDQGITSFGDLAMLSFHATKVFTTFEGGAVISKNAEMKLRIDRLKNFGFVDEVTVIESGINGKMNEFQAALGLIQLKGVNHAIERRKVLHDKYRELLCDCRGITLPRPRPMVKSNYSYFPILVNSDYRMSRDELYSHLVKNGIHARRYFYPLISELPMYRHLSSAGRSNLPVAYRIASQILCIPLHPMMTENDVERICNVII